MGAIFTLQLLGAIFTWPWRPGDLHFWVPWNYNSQFLADYYPKDTEQIAD